MKNKGLIAIILGIVLIGIGSFLLINSSDKNSNNENKENSENNENNNKEPEIPELDVNATVYVNTDIIFKYMYVTQDENGDYYVQARNRKYELKQNYLTPEDHGIRLYLTKTEDGFENEEHQLKITINGDTATLDYRNQENDRFSGVYKTFEKTDRYKTIDIDESTIIGFYKLDTTTKKAQFTIIDYDDENYAITGYISKGREYVAFANDKINKSTNTLSFTDDDYLFSIDNDVLTIKVTNPDLVGNGEYKRMTNPYYNELINEIENNAYAGDGVEMIY